MHYLVAGVRSARIAAVAAAAIVSITGCGTTLGGTPQPQAQNEKTTQRESEAAESAMILRQSSGEGPLYKFADWPMMDACSILSFENLERVGYKLGMDESPGQSAVLKTTHFIDNGSFRGVPKGTRLSQWPSDCVVEEASGPLLVLQIDQRPFSSGDVLKSLIRQFEGDFLRKDNSKIVRREDNHHGNVIRVKVTPGRRGGDSWMVGITDEDKFVARLLWNDSSKLNDKDRFNKVIDMVSERLSQGLDLSPMKYSYSGVFSRAAPPCELFTANDFDAAAGARDSGRVEENYSLGQKALTPGRDELSSKWKTTHYVEATCVRSDTLDAITGIEGKSMTATFKYFSDQVGAEQSNAYNCSGDARYPTPFGKPHVVREKIGDGFVCFISMKPYTPRFQFKKGNWIVELNDIDKAMYVGEGKMFVSAAKLIAARLR